MATSLLAVLWVTGMRLPPSISLATGRDRGARTVAVELDGARSLALLATGGFRHVLENQDHRRLGLRCLLRLRFVLGVLVVVVVLVLGLVVVLGQRQLDDLAGLEVGPVGVVAGQLGVGSLEFLLLVGGVGL